MVTTDKVLFVMPMSVNDVSDLVTVLITMLVCSQHYMKMFKNVQMKLSEQTGNDSGSTKYGKLSTL